MDTKIPWLMLPLFFLCFFFTNPMSPLALILSINQSLSGDETIVSTNGMFELGFFKPGNSSNYYIGTWYKKESHPHTVWVGNRERPVRDIHSSILKISDDGNLVLLDESQTQIWSTNILKISLYNLSFSYVSNENESYITYSYDNPLVISQNGIDASGQFKSMLWLTNLFFSLPRQQCEVYGFCGAFGSCNENSKQFGNCLTGFQPTSPKEWNRQLYSGGCVRQTMLVQCDNTSVGHGREDQFLESRNTTFPTNPQHASAHSIMECKSICLINCSCTAYAYDDTNGCSIWIGDLFNMKQLGENEPQGKSFYIRIAESEFSSPKNNKKLIIVVVAVSSGLLLLGLAMIIIKRRWRRRSIVSTKLADGSLMAFGYKDLQKATNNFSETLGKGGFGEVFKGTFPNTSLIAVKKLDSINQEEKQFRTEVSVDTDFGHSV